MKTFGELNIGDKVYSLNQNEWGVLTEHVVTGIERNDFRTILTLKGYLRYQIIGDPEGPKADLDYFALNKSAIGEVAPSVEGVKLHWLQETEDRIKHLEDEISKLQKRLENEYNALEKIQNIN